MAADRIRRLERLTWALVTAITAVSLVILWTVFLSTAFGDQNRALALETDRLQRATRIFAAGLGHLLDESRLVLDLLDRQVAFHPDSDPLQNQEFLAQVDLVQTHDSGELDLKAAAGNGNLLVFGPKAQQSSVSVADRDYFRVQRPYPGVGFFVDVPVRSRVAGHWELVLSKATTPNRGGLAVLFSVIDFRKLGTMVDSLSADPGQEVSVYRADGSLLYRNPLPADFPREPGPSPMVEVARSGLEQGMLAGTVLRSYQKIADLPVWVVVARPEPVLTEEWNRTFVRQLVWVSLLTLALAGAAIGVIFLLRKLREIRLHLEDLTRTDPLTGLLNRRAFLERCNLEKQRLDRSGQVLGLVLLDLDHFKMVNDRFGHQAGDRALKEFAAAITRTVRATDAVARTGGEEFAVLLPSIDGPGVIETAERIRAEVATIALPEGNLTTSIGVALWKLAETFDSWYHRADQALYEAKSTGRNRVITAR